MAKEYILADIVTKLGQKNNSYIHDITWVDLEDLTVYTTVVDESYRNWSRNGWQTIIEGERQLGAYTGLIPTARINNDNLKVLSADSFPSCVTPLSEREVELIIDYRRTQLGLD